MCIGGYFFILDLVYHTHLLILLSKDFQYQKKFKEDKC